jgi:hypothetical protein
LLPQRALGFIKANHPALFIQTFLDLFIEMWENNVDVSKPDLLATVLSKRFSSLDVKSILEGANSAEYKQLLNDKTKEALDHGAFGCPWFWVTNSKGEEEPFFGSDRCVPCFSLLAVVSQVLAYFSTSRVDRLWRSKAFVSLRSDVWGKDSSVPVGSLSPLIGSFLVSDWDCDVKR